MRLILALIIILLSCPNVLALDVVYPKCEKYTTSSPTSFFIGSADMDKPLIINNENVPVHKSGGFAHFVNLKYGENIFEIKSGNETLKYTINSTCQKTSAITGQTPSVSGIKQFDYSKIFLTKSKRSVIRKTPSTAGFNRVVQLGENIPLYSDAECGKFYRVNFGSKENYWILKSDVKKDFHEISDGAMIISKKFEETDEFYIYRYKFIGKSPYIISENSDKSYKNGLGLNFYNLLNKPDIPTEIYFPLQNALFGYSAEYSDNDFVLKIRKIPVISKSKPLKNITKVSTL